MALTIVPWPEGVPSCIMPLSAQGGLRDNRYSFETDSRQLPIERPRSSWTPEVYNVTLTPISRDQFAAFQSWYRDQLAYGTNGFIFDHPITGYSMNWRIVRGDPPYQVRKLRLMPQGSGVRGVSLSFQMMSADPFANPAPLTWADSEGEVTWEDAEGEVTWEYTPIVP